MGGGSILADLAEGTDISTGDNRDEAGGSAESSGAVWKALVRSTGESDVEEVCFVEVVNRTGSSGTDEVRGDEAGVKLASSGAGTGKSAVAGRVRRPFL